MAGIVESIKWLGKHVGISELAEKWAPGQAHGARGTSSLGRPKITIIGGGAVGTCCALWTGVKELGDVVVIDIPQAEKTVQGHMLDLQEASTIEHFDARFTTTTKYEEMRDSDIVIITAGKPQKPGQSRDGLLQDNCKIVKSAAEKVKEYAPDSIVIVLSNPLDAMVYVAWKITGFPHYRVLGQAGCLDVGRFKTFIAMETGFSVEDINALLVGGHGDDMVPLTRFTNISGIPVTNFLSDEKLAAVAERAKKGASEIINLTGASPYIAPASGTIQMVEAIVHDKKRILTCSAYCNGEYNIHNLFVGVPCVLGKDGVERIVTVDLNHEEQQLLKKSVDHVADVVEQAKKACPDVA